MALLGRTARVLKGVGYCVQLFCFAHLINQYVLELTFCIGPSMLPTFRMTGDIILVDRISQRFRALRTGDVIVCTSPAVPGRAVLKRILATAGDNVCVDPTAAERRYLNVPDGHVWVGGDNLSNSTDSRSYGPVAIGLIHGRVFARVWPKPELIPNNLIIIPAK